MNIFISLNTNSPPGRQEFSHISWCFLTSLHSQLTLIMNIFISLNTNSPPGRQHENTYRTVECCRLHSFRRPTCTSQIHITNEGRSWSQAQITDHLVTGHLGIISEGFGGSGREGKFNRPPFIGFYHPTDSQGHQSRWPSHSGFQSDIHKVEFLPAHLWYKPCGAYGKKVF